MNTSDLAALAAAKTDIAEIYNSLLTNHTIQLSNWNEAISRVWDSESPAIRLAEMGTKAAYIFDASNKTYTYLESIIPGCCASGLAKVQPCTVHEDGTVTIDVLPDPDPQI